MINHKPFHINITAWYAVQSIIIKSWNISRVPNYYSQFESVKQRNRPIMAYLNEAWLALTHQNWMFFIQRLHEKNLPGLASKFGFGVKMLQSTHASEYVF